MSSETSTNLADLVRLLNRLAVQWHLQAEADRPLVRLCKNVRRRHRARKSILWLRYVFSRRVVGMVDATAASWPKPFSVSLLKQARSPSEPEIHRPHDKARHSLPRLRVFLRGRPEIALSGWLPCAPYSA